MDSARAIFGRASTLRGARGARAAPAARPPRPARRGLGGFSAIELMVAMTISLVLIAGVLSVVFSSKTAYYENDRVARAQESGRAALELVLRDLRGAGFVGCAQPISGLFQLQNQLQDANLLLWNFGTPLQGFAATGANWTPNLDPALVPAALAATATPGSDIIAVRTVPSGSQSFSTVGVTLPSAPAITVSIQPGESLPAGQPIVISDCANATVFVLGSFAAGGATATLSPIGPNGPDPTNVTTSFNSTFAAGARVAPVSTVIYFVAPSATSAQPDLAPGPSLWRIVGSAAPAEVIPGVQAMQVRYGVDTNGDTYVDEYDTADVVDAAGNWPNVISINFALLLRSAEPNAQELDTRQYNLLGTAFGPFNDHYERTVFTTTVALRNRTS
jgi:type IV pilus assembly protein PilW